MFKPLTVCLFKMDSISVCSIRKKLCWAHVVGRPPLTCRDVKISDEGGGRGGWRLCHRPGLLTWVQLGEHYWPHLVVWDVAAVATVRVGKFLVYYWTFFMSARLLAQSRRSLIVFWSLETLTSQPSLESFLGAVESKLVVPCHAVWPLFWLFWPAPTLNLRAWILCPIKHGIKSSERPIHYQNWAFSHPMLA